MEGVFLLSDLKFKVSEERREESGPGIDVRSRLQGPRKGLGGSITWCLYLYIPCLFPELDRPFVPEPGIRCIPSVVSRGIVQVTPTSDRLHNQWQGGGPVMAWGTTHDSSHLEAPWESGEVRERGRDSRVGPVASAVWNAQGARGGKCALPGPVRSTHFPVCSCRSRQIG